MQQVRHDPARRGGCDSRIHSRRSRSRLPQKSGGALKIILIVVAVIVVFGILAVGAFSFFAYRIARHSRVHNENGNVRVETPFGTREHHHRS